jgi:hypothetical protein
MLAALRRRKWTTRSSSEGKKWKPGGRLVAPILAGSDSLLAVVYVSRKQRIEESEPS